MDRFLDCCRNAVMALILFVIAVAIYHKITQPEYESVDDPNESALEYYM